MKQISMLILFVMVSTSAYTEAPRVDLRNVEVGGEIGRRIDVTINNNLMVVDVDAIFLKGFRNRGTSGTYVGLGKFIDSLVRLSAYSKNDQLIKRKNYIVEETIKTQDDDGYIGMFKPEKRMWELWDIHEMTYIVNGLVSDYQFFDTKDSLKAATKLMDYIVDRWTAEPDGMKDCPITVFMAVTGLEETLLMMYEVTQNKKYLDFCAEFRALPEWDYPIDLGRWDKIGGHAYAYLHRCLSQLRLSQITDDPSLHRKTDEVMSFLRKDDGLMINGVCSHHECWHNTQNASHGLGETCSTVYLLKVLDELISMRHDSIYGDMMERTVFNGLFSAQSPDGRWLRYYVPLESKRVYYKGDSYCCPCNYRRGIADLPGMIYYRMDGGIAVNLYAPSTVSTKLENGLTVTLTQETNYPNNGKVKIVVEPEKETQFPLSLRIPRWCEEAAVSIYSNGAETNYIASRGSYYSIKRVWKKGDVIEIDMPMKWRLVKGRKVQSGRVALLRGPVLFSLNPKLNPMLKDIELRHLVVDEETLEGPFPDDTVRPDGLACTIKGWDKMGFTTSGKHNLTLKLTESTDPDIEATYLQIRRIDQVGVDDELIVKR